MASRLRSLTEAGCGKQYKNVCMTIDGWLVGKMNDKREISRQGGESGSKTRLTVD